MALASGSHLGPYEIVALAGAGGIGEVYRARDTRLDRTVAIKVLSPQVAALPGFAERFEREARAISAIEHPHICTLFDIRTERVADRSIDFLVMQFVDGETLAERIVRGPLPMPDVLAIARQIAGGLEAAHERGILHRDLKPSNVKIATDGEVKILDFGLAKALDPRAQSVISNPSLPPTYTASPTNVGAVMGTAAYMSPEQARGKVVDKRTDIWAFGCVLFEMLTGRPVFEGETVTDILAAVVGREPDWSALPANTPRRVRDLIRRCLRRDAARRLRDIGDARIELEDSENEDERAEAMRPASSRRSLVLAWSVAGVAALLALASFSGLISVRHSAVPRPAMRFSTVTNYSGVEAQPSLSPDGRSVAFISNRDGQWDIYVGLVTGGSPVRITNDPNLEVRPRWSPDGTRLLFSRLNDAGLYDIWTIPALGGIARRIVANAFHPSWSADGRSIAYSVGGSIWTSEPSGANPRQITRADAFRGDMHPALSHDGRSLACIRRRFGVFGSPYTALLVVDVASGSERLLTTDDALALSPVWSPDDRFIYFTWSRGGAVNVWKIPAGSGEPEQVTAGQGDDTDIDLSADGKRLVFSTQRQNVNLAEISLDPASKGQLKWLTTDSARGENTPRYSPDGRRIAYFSARSGAEHESIWVMDADGGNATKLVEDDDRINIHPRWTGDSQELVFLSRKSAAPAQVSSVAEIGELRRVPVFGGVPQSLPVKPWSSLWGDVARDGRIIYRTSATAGEVYDPRTNRRQPVPDLRGEPSWSPDGKSYTFIVRPSVGEPSDAGLWVGTLGGPQREVFRGCVVWMAWSGVEELLLVEGKPNLNGVMWRIDANGRNKTVVLDSVPLFTRTDILGFIRFDVHPDGRRIVIEAVESFEADISVIDNVR